MSAIHPDEAALLRSIVGDLPERRQASLKRHVARCRPCRKEREATKRLHERLCAAGESLAFAAGDPFAARPVSRQPAAHGSALGAMAAALGRLEDEKGRIRAAIEADASGAVKELDFGDAAARLAAAHLLEETVTGDPSKEFVPFAEGVASRLEEEPPEGEVDADAVASRAQIVVLGRLVLGNWQLFCGHPENASAELGAAWAALADFDAPEHLVAWVETGESLRRSYLGRPVEGRLLAERALATFERYGLGRGIMRGRHARAVALYTASGFREAHREFRAVLGSKAATRLDCARAVSGAALCLAARGRFHEAAKEYSRVRRKLRGDGAQIEQYLLQGEMKAVLSTAGRWHPRRDGRAAFALPEAGGAFQARRIAAEIVKIAGEQGIEAAKARLAAIEADPARGYALLYAAQLAMPKVSSDPAMYVELAKAIAAASRSLPFLRDKGPAQPVCREQVMGEAQLLESNALNYLGRCAESRKVAQQARVSFVEAGEDSFALAVVDYYEGSAASFECDYKSAWTLLRKSLEGFHLHGQENWAGKAEAALGTLLLNRGKKLAAIHFLDGALTNLHSEQDGSAYAQLLANRGYALVQMGKLEAAKATYAKALGLARRLDLKVAVFIVRYGLASIELKKGLIFKAVHSFSRIAEDARTGGLQEHVLSAELRVAECLGRLGKREEMLTRIRALRREIPSVSVEFDPAIRELFDQADAADVSSELVAHVVEYLEAREYGVQKGYRPFKLVKGGG